MSYPEAAWERAMKVQEVIMKALTGELHWYRAADILGFSPRTLRRWRERYEQFGYDGLLDLRRRTPSPKRAAVAEVTRVVALYREQYRGFNARHFHQIARREHAVTLSYSFVKQALQLAGLVKKGRVRGRHRRRREPRACLGELLHIDGSLHAWLAHRPFALPPSGISASLRGSTLATRSSLTPNTTSESRYLSPSMKTCVISGWWPGASTRKCTWAGRIAWRRTPMIISPTGPSVGIG